MILKAHKLLNIKLPGSADTSPGACLHSNPYGKYCVRLNLMSLA